MADLRDRIYHRRSAVISKRPELIDIDDGELAINYNANEPGLYFRDLAEDGTRKIRKIGPIHFGPTPPNNEAALLGFPIELSNGECWVDTSAGEEKYLLKVWNANTSRWVEVSAIYARTEENLDQFLDGEDGDDFIHTDGIRLKINNKTALTGLSTTNGNKLFINENNEFANGIELNGTSFLLTSEQIEAIGNDIIFKPHEGYTFTTDSATGQTQTVFEYSSHGLFDGERVYVFGTLIDNITPSPVPEGEYFVADITANSFRLKDANGTYIDSTGNIYVSYSPEIIVDRDRNVIQAGNFGLKSVDDIISVDSKQIAEKTWDVFHNPTNGNVRVFARVGNEIEQIETSVLSIDVKSAEVSDTILAGDPVYYAGKDFATGLAKVAIAKASDNTKMRPIGLASINILPGSKGTVTILGIVKGVDTTSISGQLPNQTSNVGRIVYVGENGGLTFDVPNTEQNIISSLGIVLSEGQEGAIFVNHPNSFVSLPNLNENYIWAGITNNEAVAHYLLPTTFKRTFDELTETWEIGLADNIEFGGYKFGSDGEAESGIETFIETSSIPADSYIPTDIERFSSSYRSAKYTIQISGVSADGTDTAIYQICEILIIHNNANAFITEYGMISTYNNERLGIFDAYVDNVNSEVVLTFQKFPLVLNSVNIKSVRTSILV